MVEDAISKPDISKSVQRFQLAIDEAKVRLDHAVSPGIWLVPSNLPLNTQSMVGYDNSLKKASSDMKPGVRKSVNLGMNSVGVRHMNGGSLKIKRPTSQALGLVSNRLPSNKINKTSIKVKVETPPRLDKINHDMVKVGLISAGLVSAFLLHRLFF